MSTATVHLLRHGEVYNPDRVLYGRLPEFHLSELGNQMAVRAAEYFTAQRSAGANITHLVSSPLVRAQETARPTSAALGLEIVTDDRIIEAANRFEGLSQIKNRLKEPKYWSFVVNPFRPSWGEPYRDQVERMMTAIVEHRDRAVELGGRGAQAILVSHQLPIWVTRRSAEGKALWHDPRKRECTLTSVTSLDFEGESLVGVRYAEPSVDLLANAANIPGA
ncbi:histidine phosphatase family protein [Paeniglutamicibacter sp. MACA_103]|uniref:histidine phosphatase family protein n=1 Tax=Paeniglutamicibacter sp. MACA_103 TaxID=3377337 RepID=UPI003893272D